MNQKTGKHIPNTVRLLTPSPSSSSFSPPPPPPVMLPETEAEEEGEEPSEQWLHIKSKRAGVRENRKHLRGHILLAGGGNVWTRDRGGRFSAGGGTDVAASLLEEGEVAASLPEEGQR